jgi:hypothetical protein
MVVIYITKSALAMHLIQPCLIVIFANLHFSYFHSDLVNALDPLNGEAASLMMLHMNKKLKVVILVKFLQIETVMAVIVYLCNLC